VAPAFRPSYLPPGAVIRSSSTPSTNSSRTGKAYNSSASFPNQQANHNSSSSSQTSSITSNHPTRSISSGASTQVFSAGSEKPPSVSHFPVRTFNDFAGSSVNQSTSSLLHPSYTTNNDRSVERGGKRGGRGFYRGNLNSHGRV
jgi:hypothetical protein